ncbi:MAG: glycosyltransferase, partial [Sediminibacterium sp.]|nr:glycosyltransferase [Sediminibacterium sp.]
YPIVYSGYETFVKEVSERLVAQNIDVRVYCQKHLFNVRPKNVNGVELVYMPTVQTKSLNQLVHSFFCMIHACFSKTDVILVVNAANGPFGLISLLAQKKTLINVDGLEWLRPKWKGLGAAYFKFAAKLATLFYNTIITDAEAMRQVYLQTFNSDSTVIAYGANIRHSKNPELISQFGLTPNEYFLIVGRLIPDNNSDLILEGFKKAHSNKKLVIVGDVPYQDAYAQKMKAQASDQILFLGYITDSEVLAELYHQSYAYLHGHEYGGTNPTMLKAMAYGCAILALDTVFNREMLENGQFGWFFQKTSDSVALYLQQAEHNPQAVQTLKEKARDGITQKYNWDEVTRAYVTVFKALMTNGKSHP